ncbi:MAG TPA: hypothetical protein VFZ40_14120 [Pyrinomonadaceae bacterium]
MEKPGRTSPAKEKLARKGRPFEESAGIASWIFGGLILLFLMLIVFVDIDPIKFPIVRFLMALSAGFFATFFVGGIILHGTLRGIAFSAAGGIALFILIQFVFDPFQVLPARSSTALPGPIPAATQSPPATQTPAVTHSPSATPTEPSESTSHRDRTVSTEVVATPNNKATPPSPDVGETLKRGEGWNQSGNPRDKQKALDLFRTTIKRPGCDDNARNLLKEADDAYANQNYDTAFERYKAVLRLCQNK